MIDCRKILCATLIGCGLSCGAPSEIEVVARPVRSQQALEERALEPAFAAALQERMVAAWRQAEEGWCAQRLAPCAWHQPQVQLHAQPGDTSWELHIVATAQAAAHQVVHVDEVVSDGNVELSAPFVVALQRLRHECAARAHSCDAVVGEVCEGCVVGPVTADHWFGGVFRQRCIVTRRTTPECSEALPQVPCHTAEQTTALRAEQRVQCGYNQPAECVVVQSDALLPPQADVVAALLDESSAVH